MSTGASGFGAIKASMPLETWLSPLTNGHQYIRTRQPDIQGDCGSALCRDAPAGGTAKRKKL
jgi:hypothetical protein